MITLFKCNGERCESCDLNGDCKHTTNIQFAENFVIKEGKADNGENFLYAVEKIEDAETEMSLALTRLSRKVHEMTNMGFYVWQIADVLGISEVEVVRLQGRS